MLNDIQIGRRALLRGSSTLGALAATPARAATLRPIAVIGATARSALDVLKQGLAQGRRVTGFARNPERIGVSHANFIPAQGDIYDRASIEAALQGDEVVISLVGNRYVDGRKPEYIDLYSVGGSTVLSAMRRRGNRRIITMTSGGTEQIPPSQPAEDADPSDKVVWSSRHTYQDMQRWEKILAVSDMDYVVLRPRRLATGPVRYNLKFTSHPNHAAFTTRTGGHKSTVTYADVAAFTLTLIDGTEHLGTAVGLYSDLFLGDPVPGSLN
jgi:putative NADH-flavin reductase